MFRASQTLLVLGTQAHERTCVFKKIRAPQAYDEWFSHFDRKTQMMLFRELDFHDFLKRTQMRFAVR